MTPELKKIGNKLFDKVELSSVKVELALSDDLKQGISFLEKAKDAVNKQIANYEASYKLLQTETNGAKSVLNTQSKLINMVEEKAKDLGINPTTIPGYNDINKAWQLTSSAIDKSNEF
jgi:hypothetical protein